MQQPSNSTSSTTKPVGWMPALNRHSQGEVTQKQRMLEEAEFSPQEARKETMVLELANGALRYERDNILYVAEAKEARLEEIGGELGKENSELYDRVTSLQTENALILLCPSMFITSKYSNISREQYEEWIHAEVRMDMIHDLNKVGSIFQAALEDARVKAREAWLSCNYDSATPQADSEEDEKEGVDRLGGSAWCDSAYGQGEDGEDIGGQDGDVHQFFVELLVNFCWHFQALVKTFYLNIKVCPFIRTFLTFLSVLVFFVVIFKLRQPWC